MAKLFTLRRGLTAVITLLVLAASAEAQEGAKSFDDLRTFVRSGDSVSVTDNSGREVTGRITRLSASSLAMVINGSEQEVLEAEVATIRQRRRDSLKNGALWGLVGGAAFAGTLSVLMGEASDSTADHAGFVASYTGLGAAIGIGVDALFAGRRVVYRRPTTATGQLAISPMLTATRGGLLVTVGF